ncbi:MAG: universal stress protein [Vicinamibacterales bacterium]
MRVLLATDGSEYSEAAALEMARLGLPAGTQVSVVFVAETPQYGVTTSPYPVPLNLTELEAAQRERGNVAVARAREILEAGAVKNQITVTTKVVSGAPKQSILAEAEQLGADLIVVGACGHGRIERFFIGSVAQAVAMHAKCSVQIARKKES